MKPFEIPKCKQQKEFEDLAINLIKVMAQMTVDKWSFSSLHKI